VQTHVSGRNRDPELHPICCAGSETLAGALGCVDPAAAPSAPSATATATPHLLLLVLEQALLGAPQVAQGELGSNEP